MKKNKYFAKKCKIAGIEFDSIAESEFYLLLKNNKNVKVIQLQPEYQIIDEYMVECSRCNGTGKILNKRTGNLNQCTLCKGAGSRTKRGAIYTADFRVIYSDGHEEVIDVKGGRESKDFTLRRKLFEIETGRELKIARKTKQGWENK